MNTPFLQMAGSLLPEFPRGMLLGGLVLAFLAGVLLARLHLARSRRIAAAIDAQLRKIQGEYDLVSRDVVKVRQDLNARLAKHEPHINRWTRV